MDRRLRRLAVAFCLAGGALLTAACGATGVDPAARVNGEVISRAELQREVERVALRLSATGPGGRAALPPEVRAGTLDRLITLRLMRQQAKREGIAVDGRAIEERIARVVAEAGGRQQLLEILQSEAYSGADFRQAIEDLLLSERLSEKHLQAPATIEERRVRHVLVDSADKALAARQRLAGGESWEKVAAEVSADPGSRGRGGDLGFIQRGQTVPPFDQAAFALPLNELSQPVQTSFGYHILLVTEARSQAPTPEQAAALRQRAFSSYLQQLRQQAQVEIFGEAAPAPAGARP
jgi:parvulin-like peptidyl-prolyl isomerase